MSFENQVYSHLDEAQYNPPKPEKDTDLTQVGGVDGKNKNSESTEKPGIKDLDFNRVQRSIALNNAAEAQTKAIDHPTPEEILSGLGGVFGGSAEKPKNSSEGGSQVAEGNASQRENPSNA